MKRLILILSVFISVDCVAQSYTPAQIITKKSLDRKFDSVVNINTVLLKTTNEAIEKKISTDNKAIVKKPIGKKKKLTKLDK